LKDITKEIKKRRTGDTEKGQSDFTAQLWRTVTVTDCLGVRKALLKTGMLSAEEKQYGLGLHVSS
jgi:hypothetical protein